MRKSSSSCHHDCLPTAKTGKRKNSSDVSILFEHCQKHHSLSLTVKDESFSEGSGGSYVFLNSISNFIWLKAVAHCLTVNG